MPVYAPSLLIWRIIERSLILESSASKKALLKIIDKVRSSSNGRYTEGSFDLALRLGTMHRY